MTQTEAGSAFRNGIYRALPLSASSDLVRLVDYLVKNGYARALALSAIALTLATLAVIGAIWSSSVDNAVIWAIPAGLLGGGWSVGLYAQPAIYPSRPDESHWHGSGDARR